MFFQYYNEEETKEIINKNNKNIYDELDNYYEIINKEETTRDFSNIYISSDLQNIISHFHNKKVKASLFCNTNERNIVITTFEDRFKICMEDKDNLDYYYYCFEIKILTHNNYYYMFCGNGIFVDLFIIHTSVINEDKLMFLAMDNIL